MENERVDFSNIPVNDSPTPVNWRGRVFHVRPILDPQDAVGMVNDVMSFCYKEDGSTIVPEMLDYAIRLNVVLRYTDIMPPKDSVACYKFLYLTDIYETALKHISKGQINSIIDAAKLMIGYR